MLRQVLKYSRLILDRTTFVKPQKRFFTSNKIFLFDQFFLPFCKSFLPFLTISHPSWSNQHVNSATFTFFCLRADDEGITLEHFRERAHEFLFYYTSEKQEKKMYKSSENKTIELRRQKSRQFRIQMSSQSLSSLDSRSLRICVVCNAAVCPSSRRTAGPLWRHQFNSFGPPSTVAMCLLPNMKFIVCSKSTNVIKVPLHHAWPWTDFLLFLWTPR